MGNCYFRCHGLKWSQHKLTLSTFSPNALQRLLFFYTFEILGGVFAIGFTNPIKGNQYVYMARLKQSITGAPESDWFLNTPDSNPIFTAICKILVFGNSYFFVNIVNISLIFLSFHFLVEVSRLILGIENRGRDHLFLITIAILGFCVYRPDFHNGIAGMGVFSPQFQPSSFDGLLLISILSVVKTTFYPNNKSNTPQIMLPLVIAVAVHPSIFVSAVIVLIAFFLSKSKMLMSGQRKRISWLHCLLLLILIVSPFLLKFISLENLIYSKSEIIAFDYLAHDRIPYHAVPSNFMNFLEGVRLLIILVGTYIVFQSNKLSRKLKYFILFLTVCFMYFSIGVTLIDKSVFFLAVPWRITGVIYPLFSLILLWKLVAKLSEVKQTSTLKLRSFQLLSLSIFLLVQNMSKFLTIYLLILLIRTNFFEDKNVLFARIKNKREIGFSIVIGASIALALTAQVSTSQAWRENSEGFPDGDQLVKVELNGIGVVPPQFNNFRVDYGLNIFVDSKAPPFDGDYLAEWMRRLKIAESVQIHPKMLCTDSSLAMISWAVVPNGLIQPSCFSSRTDLSKDWLLLQK